MNGFVGRVEFENAFKNNPIIIFDTNIYLDLLRYSKETSEKMIDIYYKVEKCIWVPAQVQKEFNKNFSIVLNKRISEAKEKVTSLKNIVEKCKTDLNNQLKYFYKYNFSNIEEFSLSIDTNLINMKNSINSYYNSNIKKFDNVFLKEQKVKDLFNKLFKNSHDVIEYKQNELIEIYREGDIRYKYKVPPGYMDDPQNNKDSKKYGMDMFGDLIMWKEIIRYGSKHNQNVIFVTSDEKEDWFELKNKAPYAPREELIKEYQEQANGNKIILLPSSKFIEYIAPIYSIDNSMILLEMEKEQFVDNKLLKDLSEQIKIELKKWSDTKDNLALIPFSQDVNEIVSFEKMALQVKDIFIEKKEDIALYNVTLEAVTNIEGAYYDNSLERYTTNHIRELFRLTINLTFERIKNNEEEGIDLYSDSIDNLKLDTVSFEKCDSDNTVIKTNRGLFYEPSKKDFEIYKYMKSIWADFNKRYTVDEAEALVFIEASKHFSTSLININRSFSLVQNSKINFNLSLNEIDALALKRFKDIGFNEKEGQYYYNEVKVELGDPLPLPDSMKVMEPETGREIDVTFSINHEYVEDKYIIIKGKTNLPAGTYIMVSLKNLEIDYYGSSKAVVKLDGSFESEIFKNGKNIDGEMKFVEGLYNVEITVPIVSVQPDNVKTYFGINGRNLIGDYVVHDAIMGNSIEFKKDVKVDI